VARVLIVGCGCRGRALAAALVADGHSVRGTTRREGAVEAIEATGAQAALADPDRLSTVLPRLEGVSIVCWLMGTAVGRDEAVAALHGPRLESLLERLVDTPVRGVVYEAAGRVERRRLEEGAGIARAAAGRWRIPAEVVEQDPADGDAWLEAMQAAVRRLLS
jgi:hypothetical protein